MLLNGDQVLIAHQERKELSHNADHHVVHREVAQLLKGNVQSRSYKLQAPVAAGFAAASLWHGPRQILLAPAAAQQLAAGTSTFSSDQIPHEAYVTGERPSAVADALIERLANMILRQEVGVRTMCNAKGTHCTMRPWVCVLNIKHCVCLRSECIIMCPAALVDFSGFCAQNHVQPNT